VARVDVNERASAVSVPSQGRLRGVLARVYQGGEPGRRRALVLIYGYFAPLVVISSYVVVGGSDWWTTALLKLAVILVALVWLWKRSAPRRWEWVTAAAVVPAFSALVTGLAGSGKAALVPLLGVPMVLGVLALVLDGPALAVALLLDLIAAGIVIFHHLPTLDAVLLTSAAVLGVSVEVAVIYGTASYLRRSLGELEAAADERQRLHAEMALAGDRERAQIAGELHDDTLQVMTAAAIGLDGLAGSADPATAGKAAAIGSQVRDAIDRTRRLSFDLYPANLGAGGIARALAEMGRRAAADAPFQVVVEADGARASQDAERLAYRTIRELVGNAVKHAQASTISIGAASRNGHLSCEVRDDGRGFDPEAVAAESDDYHFGLAAAAERIRLYGGTFVIDSAPGRGTRVAFTVPAGSS
jgi:signal transduction histidine kinase